MEFSAATTAGLTELCTALDLDPDKVSELLTALVCDLRRAIPSYAGLQLVLYEHGYPLVISALLAPSEPDGIGTSLQVPLSALLQLSQSPDGAAEAEGHLTLFAGQPGAFVDLAADLCFALRSRTSAENGSGPTTDSDLAGRSNGLRLDEDRTPASGDSRPQVAAAVSTLNRAIGFLIGNGHEPDDAHSELVRRAATGGVTVLVCAAQLLRPADL